MSTEEELCIGFGKKILHSHCHLQVLNLAYFYSSFQLLNGATVSSSLYQYNTFIEMYVIKLKTKF